MKNEGLGEAGLGEDMMKTLLVEGGPRSTFAFFDEVQRIARVQGWQRDRHREHKCLMRNHAAGDYATIELCLIPPDGPRGRVFFVLQESGDMTVTHIEPMESSGNARSVYDKLLYKFYQTVVHPASIRTGVSVSYGESARC